MAVKKRGLVVLLFMRVWKCLDLRLCFCYECNIFGFSSWSDFQKVANVIQGFLGKLACEEATAELRDTLNLALLNLQKYYKILKSRSSCNGNGFLLNSLPRSLGGSLTSNGGISPVSPSCWSPDHFEWKWFNLDSPKLTASIGGEELSLLPPILQAAKEGEYEALGEMIENGKDIRWSISPEKKITGKSVNC